jgi:alanine racemase
MDEVVALGLTPTLYTQQGVEAAAKAVALARPGGEPLAVHVKVDTGMHRVGATADDAVALARQIAAHPSLELQGLWTHFAVADDVAAPETGEQLGRLLATAERLAEFGIEPRYLHAANSAAALLHPASRLDLVRCGIALYGLAPAAALVDQPPCSKLRPAFSLMAHVSYVKVVEAGERLSYGLRYRVPVRSVVATLPVGYADGVTRSLFGTGGQVLLGGRRHPIAGTVTMDQILVDCGPDAEVAVGDTAVLLGRQGEEEITAWEWAERLGTIAYEVVCGVTPRVPRRYRG